MSDGATRLRVHLRRRGHRPASRAARASSASPSAGSGARSRASSPSCPASARGRGRRPTHPDDELARPPSGPPDRPDAAAARRVRTPSTRPDRARRAGPSRDRTARACWMLGWRADRPRAGESSRAPPRHDTWRVCDGAPKGQTSPEPLRRQDHAGRHSGATSRGRQMGRQSSASASRQEPARRERASRDPPTPTATEPRCPTSSARHIGPGERRRRRDARGRRPAQPRRPASTRAMPGAIRSERAAAASTPRRARAP